MKKLAVSSPPLKLTGKEKICIHAPLHLGDSVMSFPFVQSIKHYFPTTRISLIAKKELAALWRNQPYVNEVRLSTSTSVGLSRLSEWFKKNSFEASILLATGRDIAKAHFKAEVPIRIGHDFWHRASFLTHFIPTNGFPTDPSLARRHKVQNYLDLLKLLSIKPIFLVPKLLPLQKKIKKFYIN